jgi:hypothetical protein
MEHNRAQFAKRVGLAYDRPRVTATRFGWNPEKFGRRNPDFEYLKRGWFSSITYKY